MKLLSFAAAAFFCVRALVRSLLLSFALVVFLGSISTWFRCQRSSCCCSMHNAAHRNTPRFWVGGIGFPSVSRYLRCLPSCCRAQANVRNKCDTMLCILQRVLVCLKERQDIEVLLSFVRLKKKNRLPDCRLFFLLLLLLFSKKKVSREEEGLNKKKKNNEMLRSLLLRFLSRIRSSLLEEREKSTLLFRSFSLINSLMMITGRVDLSVQDVGFYLTWGGRKKKGGNANGHLQEKFGKYRVNKKK